MSFIPSPLATTKLTTHFLQFRATQFARCRLAAKEAAEIDTRMHDSAREIQAFFHSSQKRAQIALTLLALQTAVKTNDLKKKIYTTNAILAQKVFRGWSCRIFFVKKNIDVTKFPQPEGWKVIAAQRVVIDFANRRAYQRTRQIGELEVLKKTLKTRNESEAAWVHQESEHYEKR